MLFAAAVIYVPVLQTIFSTAGLPLEFVAFVLPFPFIVWGADELRRYFLRRRSNSGRIAPRGLVASNP